MPQLPSLRHATLSRVWPMTDGTFSDQPQGGGDTTPHLVTVQFNPATLKTAFSNQNVNSNRPQSPVQFVGKGTTKLSMELWFDATRADASYHGDVRNLTAAVSYFMTPIPDPDANSLVPPAIRVSWGSFKFDGAMDAFEETIDLFSPDGVPLRASVNIGISRAEIIAITPEASGGMPPGVAGVGSQAFAPMRAGDSLPQLAARVGVADWQSLASANGIENPRLIPPGTLVNLSLGVRT